MLPEIRVEPLEHVVQHFEILSVVSVQEVHIQRVIREAVPLKMREHEVKRLFFVAGEAYDRGDSSVRAYVFHEEELVVHRGFHVSHSVHLPAHRLSFEPDSVVAAALDKHRT